MNETAVAHEAFNLDTAAESFYAANWKNRNSQPIARYGSSSDDFMTRAIGYILEK